MAVTTKPAPKPKKAPEAAAPKRSQAEKMALNETNGTRAPKAAPKTSKYPQKVRETARFANELRSDTGRRIGPKQAALVLRTLAAVVDGPLTEKAMLDACGVKTRKALKDAALKGDTAPLRLLAKRVKDATGDGYASNPRWLAALVLGAVGTLDV